MYVCICMYVCMYVCMSVWITVIHKLSHRVTNTMFPNFNHYQITGSNNIGSDVMFKVSVFTGCKTRH